MLRNGEVVICPDCPRKTLVETVKSRSWNRQPTPDNVAKICAKIRVYETTLPQCSRYPQSEILDPWLIYSYVGCNKKRQKKMKKLKKTKMKKPTNLKMLMMRIMKKR